MTRFPAGVRTLRTVWGVTLALGVFAIASSCGRETIDLAKTTDGQTTPDGGHTSRDAGQPPQTEAAACASRCEALGGVCITGTDKCGECNSELDCNDDFRGACDPVSHKCVGCTSSKECPVLPLPIACNVRVQRCAIACNDTRQCGYPLMGCDMERGLCVECQVDNDCQPELFPAVFRRCLEGACVGCKIHDDCPAGRCDTDIHFCVGCLDSSDCSAGQACRLDTHVCVAQ